MAIQIKDRAELKRITKLLRTLDSSKVSFPIMLYRAANETAAFMEGSDRQFSVKTEDFKQRFSMSDRPGAREEWTRRENLYAPPGS